MSENNRAAIKMVTERYSAHVRSFNHLPVSDDDSDRQHELNVELAQLATAALTRAPLIKPSGNRMALLVSVDLGNIYQAVRSNLSPEERIRYAEIQEELEQLGDKYGA